MTQTIDFESNNFVGVGEFATYSILKHLTLLKPRSLKEFPRNGIYKQVPLQWIIPKNEFARLSQAHQKGSIDLFLIANQRKIAIRVQGKGHGQGLKGLGKAKHDKVQENLIKQKCDLVDILIQECKNVFKERVTNESINEIINSFKTARVMIPISS